jgi:hypothetical protein
MKHASTILFFFILPFLVHGQVKTVSPSDSLKKYQKLAMRDRDSLNKYVKLKNQRKQIHYYQLSEFRRMQLKYWMEEQDAIDAQKRRKKN